MERLRLEIKPQRSNRERRKITKAFVDGLDFTEAGQQYFFDNYLTGFGVAVGKQTKSYFAERTVKGRCCRVTIGRHVHFTAEQARQEARKLLNQMALGVNPNDEKKLEKLSGMRLIEAWQDF